jgi:DNA modification methylase
MRHGGSIDIEPFDATFRDSSRAPLHSWFPYLEGYSPRFVEGVRLEFLPRARRILEPFAGSGTTPIVLGQSGIECAYSEANPAMAFVIQTKLEVLSLSLEDRTKLAQKISNLNKHLVFRVHQAAPDIVLQASYTSTFGESVFFDEIALQNILRLRTVNDEVNNEDALLGRCLTLAVLASLIPSSRLKRAGDLRYKTPKELLAGTPCVLDNVGARLASQSDDIRSAKEVRANTHFACATAGELHNAVQGGWDGVITSPPYLNGTNYIRNARLELWYDRYIASKADLRRLRDGVITSGINDVDSQTDWRPVTKGVERVVAELEREAYDDRISKMVGGYFRDMKVVLDAASRCLNNKGRLCIDIGDSIYAGIHVPTDDLLVEVADSLGLNTVERIHLRKRTSKGGKPVRQQLLVFEK